MLRDGVRESECTDCSALSDEQCEVRCIHFDGKVIHWHIPIGDRLRYRGLHSVCGPDDAVLNPDSGGTIHIGGEATFDNPAAAEAEFRRREEELLAGG